MKRYRFRIKETNIYINVEATSIDEAVTKAHEIIKKMKLNKEILEKLRGK